MADDLSLSLSVSEPWNKFQYTTSIQYTV
jgi:hypothetical protein